MKVTYLLTSADASGGTERAVIAQANWMSRHHAVEILSVYRTAPQPHYTISDNVKVRYVSQRFADVRPSSLIPAEWDDQFDARVDGPIARTIKGLRADVVVSSTPALALLASQNVRRGTQIIHQEHRASAKRGRGLNPLVVCAGKLAVIASLTETSALWLQDRLGSAAPPLIVVPNAIDVSGAAISRLGTGLIVSAGRIVPAKRFHHVVDAFGRIAHDHPDWRLRIYGSGPDLPALRHAARRGGVESRVELPGEVRHIYPELAKASLFVMASRSEAFSLAVAEAQAAGVPVISYDTYTGPREILQATTGGIVVPDGSVAGLARAMSHLITDDARRAELGRNGRDGAWTYDTERVMPRWLEIFRAVHNGTPIPGALELQEAPRDHEVLESAPENRAPDVVTVTNELTRALDAAGITWRDATSGRDPGRWIAVGGEHRERLFDLLAALDISEGTLTSRHGREKLADSWSIGDPVPEPASYGNLIELSIGGHLCGGVEIWDSVDGLRHAPRSAEQAWVDEPTWQRWTEADTTTVSGAPYWNHATFDVDAVFTWVDGADPAWLARRREFLGDYDGDLNGDAVRDARYRNRDELFYAVAAVKRYMPWIRNIFVVTDAQAPRRVSEAYPDVLIVDHREIFPDPAVLPVFNSHAIESCLHRIDGLSEHFLYFNDDMIVARPQDKEQYFHPNGIAKFFPSGVTINYGGAADMPHLQAAANNRALLLRDFGIEITRSMLHTPYPHRVSVLRELEDRYSEEFARTRASKFRSATDLSVLSSLGQYFAFATGRAVQGSLRYRYLNLRSDGLRARLTAAAADAAADVVTLAEPMNADRRHRDEDEIVARFLAEIVYRNAQK